MPAVNLDLFIQPRPSSPEAKWARWITTEEGRALYAEIESRALAAWQAGEKRVEVNAIVAQVRHDRKVSIDNSLRSLIARKLVKDWPVLEPLVELRRRRSAE